ncbi:MAG: DUF2079 domain-containing protein [Oligoflexia bacterium]|nr:DUF2079 domain-containing protein [Oligoflexia bacterium]
MPIAESKIRRVLFLSATLSQLALWLGQRAESIYFLLPLAVFSCACVLIAWRRIPIEFAWSSVLKLYCVLMATSWSCLALIDLYSFGYNNYDTGIFAQEVANYSLSGKYFSSILQMPALGEHFTPVLLLFTPLIKLYPTLLWFPLLKVVAFIACVPILLGLSREVLGRESRLVYFVPLFWLVHALVARSMFMEFQPSALTQPIILLSFMFALRGNTRAVILCLLALLGFKEHLALIWVSVGAFYLVMLRRPVQGVTFILIGLAAGLLIYSQIMPWFADGIPNTHAGRFGPLSLLSQKFALMRQGLQSVFFLPVLAPSTFVFLLPAFGIALVSNDPQMVTYDFHYQDIALPVLFVAMICGLRAWQLGLSWLPWLTADRRRAVACIIFPVLMFTHSRYPTRQIVKSFPSQTHLEMLNSLRDIAKELPPSTTFWLQDTLGPAAFYRTDLRTVLRCSDVLNVKTGDVVGLSPLVNPWPLRREELGACIANLRRELADGKYSVIRESEELLILRRL